MAAKDKSGKKYSHSVAKQDDGTIQVNFTIKANEIKKANAEAVKELAKDIDVPGFRKGNAPLDKVKENLPQNTLVEKSLSGLLPKIFTEIIKDAKITPAIFPKFELISAEEGKDWQIRATTCEIPKIEVGDYKKEIPGLSKAKTIWTPEKEGKKEDQKERELTKEEKEQEILNILLKISKVKIPNILIEEDVNSKLSQLLQRIEKLGLTLENYLASINKKPEDLRKEYEEQARQNMSLELILTEVANKESLKADEKQIEAAINISKADPRNKDKFDEKQQRRIIEEVLKRRAALDLLINLI